MDWQRILDDIHADIAPELGKGAVANYIPALAHADPEAFGMALITTDGETFTAGDADAPFSIQSISKVFALTLALDYVGDALWDCVGREPSGSSFNSIVQLEHEHGIPRNPFINAGAIVVTDTILSHCGKQPAIEALIDFTRQAADCDTISINDQVAASERDWGHRNRGLAHFMKGFAVLDNPVETVLDAYFCQCAIEMSVRELARTGLYLAAGGTDPVTGREMTPAAHAKRINALMMLCGHYDMSGDFAYRVGLPGKSGVGGGILCIAPGVASIAVWSPALNEAGNSRAGTLALEAFAEKTGLSVF